MTDIEKRLKQEKHRLEETIARNRVKERKARTHRLIKEGAVLEKFLPTVKTVEIDELEDFIRNFFNENLKDNRL